jgi:hypothetical protein
MRFAFVVLLTVSVAGCSDADGGGNGSDAGADGDIVSLTIEPADPTVVTVNGSGPPVEFVVMAERSDGTVDAVDGRWSFDRTELGAIGGEDGEFTASGVAAGVGTVTAIVGETTATTSVTVRVEDEYFGDGVPTDAADQFGTPVTGGAASVLVYPLNGAVMPSSIKPPQVQWEGGEFGDLYRLTISAGLATVTSYLTHDGVNFTYAWPVDAGSWRALKTSADGDPIRFVLDRLARADGATYRATEHQVSMVDANLDGAIYYWDLGRGKMLRITDQGREDFMPAPPKAANGSRCVACHTVSRDGRLLAAELWGGAQPSAIFDLTADLSPDPAPTRVPPGKYNALFSTFSPDASQLLINYETRMELRDTATGDLVPSTGLPQSGAAHPTWSPDGSLVAYIANIDGSWAVDYTVGDLAVMPVSGTDFGTTQILRAADGMANAWPSFSPDSQWIAFGRGTNSRARRDDIGEVYPGSLYLIHRTGGAPIELARAAGGEQSSYLPNFSPFNEGGYYWLAFYSTRDYGNAQVGSKGTGRRQLWVTAVSNNPQAGIDPSSVPFWLPDQDVTSDNMSGYWAPRPPVD